MKTAEPENKAREVVDACSDCDVCRYLMETNCLFFPELYRLWDREMAGKEPISDRELRALVDRCNFCALCPCPDIREKIMTAKTAFIDRDGLALNIRVLEDVGRVSRVCGAFPRLANRLAKAGATGRLLRRVAGIHPDRKVPVFPDRNFDALVRERKIGKKAGSGKQKVAYFAGCTGRYLFPDVPLAALEVLDRNNIEVYYPEDQQCCGMPGMLEGDRELTLRFVSSNIERLSQLVSEGYDIVCSCPTCGYMFKEVLREGAYYSREYQTSVGGDDACLKVPAKLETSGADGNNFVMLNKSIFKDILKDEGYFSSIDPEKRILVAEHTFDLGQYLKALHEQGRFDTALGQVKGASVYYPPCHLREQNIGQPYLELLSLIPQSDTEPIRSSFYCCGIAGIMGFKRDFHETSIKMGGRLIEKIKQMNPERIITDCLSCRLQFNQMIPHPVYHPVEILCQSYKNA